jgi:anti-sigma B factor antagonist
MRLEELHFESSDGALVAYIKGEIDLSNSNKLRASLLDQMTNDVLGLVIDLSEVEYLDSAGIGVLYDLFERLRSRGQALCLVVPPESVVSKVLQLVDAGATMSVVETTDAAVARVKSNDSF